jgi:hypothetical protein
MTLFPPAWSRVPVACPRLVPDRMTAHGPLILLSRRYATGTAARRERPALAAASSTLA